MIFKTKEEEEEAEEREHAKGKLLSVCLSKEREKC